MPLSGIRSVRRDHTDVVIFNIGREQNVKAGRSQNEIAGKIFVFRIRFNELIRIHRGEYFITRDVPPVKTHVHVVSPVNGAPSDAVLNECDGICGTSFEFRGALLSKSSLPRTRGSIASVTITIRGASNRRVHIMRFDLKDVALRTLILVAGGLAALLLALKGQGQALPALAVGGTLGACVMARFGPGEG